MGLSIFEETFGASRNRYGKVSKREATTEHLIAVTAAVQAVVDTFRDPKTGQRYLVSLSDRTEAFTSPGMKRIVVSYKPIFDKGLKVSTACTVMTGLTLHEIGHTLYTFPNLPVIQRAFGIPGTHKNGYSWGPKAWDQLAYTMLNIGDDALLESRMAENLPIARDIFPTMLHWVAISTGMVGDRLRWKGSGMPMVDRVNFAARAVRYPWTATWSSDSATREERLWWAAWGADYIALADGDGEGMVALVKVALDRLRNADEVEVEPTEDGGDEPTPEEDEADDDEQDEQPEKDKPEPFGDDFDKDESDDEDEDDDDSEGDDDSDEGDDDSEDDGDDSEYDDDDSEDGDDDADDDDTEGGDGEGDEDADDDEMDEDEGGDDSGDGDDDGPGPEPGIERGGKQSVEDEDEGDESDDEGDGEGGSDADDDDEDIEDDGSEAEDGEGESDSDGEANEAGDSNVGDTEDEEDKPHEFPQDFDAHDLNGNVDDINKSKGWSERDNGVMLQRELDLEANTERVPTGKWGSARVEVRSLGEVIAAQQAAEAQRQRWNR